MIYDACQEKYESNPDAALIKQNKINTINANTSQIKAR